MTHLHKVRQCAYHLSVIVHKTNMHHILKPKYMLKCDTSLINVNYKYLLNTLIKQSAYTSDYTITYNVIVYNRSLVQEP